MITSLLIYILNMFIREIFEKGILVYQKKITLSDSTYMKNLVDLVAINVETPSMDIGYSIKKEFTKFHPYKSLNSIILDC